MIPLTLEEIARITGGRLGPGHAGGDPGQVLVHGPVVTDSRQAQPGSLYVARIGEHADGHVYAGGAAAAGAVAALVTREVTELPYVLVDDVQEAFNELREKGVEFTMEPTNAGPVSIVVLDDTCGNLIQLISEN